MPNTRCPKSRASSSAPGAVLAVTLVPIVNAHPTIQIINSQRRYLFMIGISVGSNARRFTECRIRLSPIEIYANGAHRVLYFTSRGPDESDLPELLELQQFTQKKIQGSFDE
jgi:hypothetical protein